MFRKKFKKQEWQLKSNSSISRPLPVQESQRIQVQEQIEKEKENQTQISQSENLINATQSRFKSQRATLARLTQQQIDKGKNSFEIVLYNNGLEFTEIGCELVEANRDPVTFIRSFRCFLTSQNDYKQRIQQYLNDFKNDFNIIDDDKVEKAEKYMRGIFIKDGEQKHQTQTSLIMCMLAIDGFKDQLTKILLDRLKEYVIDKKESATALIVGLVLTQFKFTDQILDDNSYDFLFEELFKILNETQPAECREVIVSNFRELSILKQEEAARRIFALYEDNKSELLKFIDILCDMSIDPLTSQKYFAVIQEHMENECSIEHYPAMIKYSQYYSQSPIDIIEMFREHVKWEKCGRKVIDEIFKLIDKLLKRDHLNVVEKWMNIISLVNNKEDLKLLDFVMLLKVADTNTENELRNVKKIIQELITKGLFTKKYLRDTFKLFKPVIDEVSQTFLELLDALQKTRDSSMLYGFLATCYKLLFRISKDSKAIIGSLTSFLCEKRASLPFSSGSEFKITILNIFYDVMNDTVSSAAALLVNYKILLRVLDYSKVELTFNEHRLFMEFLCTLVYKIDYSPLFKGTQISYINENIDTLREHLNMLVVKQTNNPEEKIKQIGQISGVKLVSSLVTNCNDDEHGSSEVATNSSESIPKGPIRDATELVTMMITQCGSNQEMLSILFDELSNEFKPTTNDRQISSIFLNWLGEMSLEQLEGFVLIPVDTQHEEINGIKLINKFELHDDEFENPEHAINLGNIIFRDKSKHMVVIPSVFKLTRLINLHRFGNIEHMAGLCSMSLVLPSEFGTDDDKLSDNEEIATLQLDLYFHTCNWLREIIGAFITSDVSIKKLVKQRLKQLIAIEKQLNRLLQKIPKGYIPPFLEFSINEDQQKIYQNIVKKFSETKIAKPPKKMRKKNDQTIIDESSNEKSSINIKSSQFCREMDNQIASLLKEKFILKGKQNEEFSTVELIYLLEDIHSKISSAFCQRKIEIKNFTDEDSFVALLKNEILPNIVKNFYKIIDEMEHQRNLSIEIDSNGEEMSLGDDEIYMRIAFSLILEIFNMIFSSKKLKQEENTEIINEMLKSLLKSDTAHLRSDQELICSAIIEKFVDIERNAQNLESAVNLINFLVTINSIYKDRISTGRIIEMAERFLRTRWVDENRKLEQGSAVNSKLEILLKIYVKKAMNQNQMKDLVAEMREISKLSDLAANKIFPCISKSNLICILRIYIRRQSELINSAKVPNMNFEFWSFCTKIEKELLETVKFLKTQVAFNLFLKNFIVYLRKFNSEGLTFLNDFAKKDRNGFIQLVKEIQHIRRMAHGLACELKHLKNNSIASILPTARQQFEVFYQSVSGIAKRIDLPSNNFNTGQLRNFGIDGNDIFSQNVECESTNTSINVESDEEEEENDDENVDLNLSEEDEENFADKQQASFRSRSTIY
ncbi:hypothetical protein PVAND_016755 [Polypedilum vanderplanki]|uniref:Fanconi anemia group D2 protein n=1 Tax=Polypedilum vanderplanki TaxID=319348 RepID=A0A9J6BGQ6_POLVA|nr:hypothetical protein PVAND_016755 [Polypedilum vanderplanki]